MSTSTAVGLPGGRGRDDPTSSSGADCLWSAGALCVSLNEAGAVAESIAAGPGQGLLSLFALLRGVAGEGLCT